jgi:hypothetical protein
MVTRNELFKSRFMNASNVDRPIVVTISFAKMETLENTKGETDEKLVVYFSDHKQNLALNGVNFDAICEISGEDDSDRWADTRIEIFRTTTEVAGFAAGFSAISVCGARTRTHGVAFPAAHRLRHGCAVSGTRGRHCARASIVDALQLGS